MPNDATLIELATLFYSCKDTDSLLRIFAAQLGVALGAGTVLVWLPADGAGLECQARWSAPGQRIEPADAIMAEGPLSEAFEGTEPVEWRVGSDDPDTLLHLAEGDREKVRAALYIPLPGPLGVQGVKKERPSL